ncbi:uncharacterized protein V6R79_005815 [Siganus canaliculatus]
MKAAPPAFIHTKDKSDKVRQTRTCLSWITLKYSGPIAVPEFNRVRWQERDAGGTEEDEDLLLGQMMVGLQPGPIKQELSRQIQRNETMTFTDACKEACTLKQELQDGESSIVTQRVTAPTSGSATAVDLERLKGQIYMEVQTELMREMRRELMEQMKTLSADLLKEVTLLSQSLFAKYLEGAGITSAEKTPWLRFRAANNLEIPYVGYALVDCMFGRTLIPGRGVIIVDDDCLGPDKGILSMNIIQAVWSALTQRNPWLSFTSARKLLPASHRPHTRVQPDCHSNHV